MGSGQRDHAVVRMYVCVMGLVLWQHVVITSTPFGVALLFLVGNVGTQRVTEMRILMEGGADATLRGRGHHSRLSLAIENSCMGGVKNDDRARDGRQWCGADWSGFTPLH